MAMPTISPRMMVTPKLMGMPVFLKYQMIVSL